MKLKFKNRIAYFNTLAASSSTLLVFAAVYLVVYVTAYEHLDKDIRKEKVDVFKNIEIEGDLISMHKSPELDEKEHSRVEVNPTFLQITNKNGMLVFQSANMKAAHLKFNKSLKEEAFFDNKFNNERIRQGQFPVLNDSGKVIGHLSVGVSQMESALVLKNLRLTLLIAFPLLTLIFYWASSFAAARGIAPIHQLIRTATQIDDRSIGTRLSLPPHRDEIYKLAATINDLLHRVENSMKREKQITEDISHELRTPLAGIRGTLEVLLRKQREPEQYEQKIEQVLLETDRMNRMLEQLLQLSRLESGKVLPNKEPVALQRFFIAFLEKWQPLISEKQVVVELHIPPETIVTADAGLLELIAGNLLSNALKYGSTGCKINLSWNAATQTLALTDDGPGIAAAHLPYIFDRFYRTDASRNVKIPGTGLGLSIAKKLAEVQGIYLRVESEVGRGTRFLMGFGEVG
ncbi:MAG: HAMP domain-containing sensor histidine kinase [Saprospiraceae bacterium]|nr:HAMP domain-containing sensor histidine kinase [Saprospiraceae bacterium]MDZ4706418.1 HAMP domain-containing sensor histidine kinase [Saprospiraceae bacterium]